MSKEVTALTAGVALTGAEVAHFVQSGNSRKITADQISAWANTLSVETQSGTSDTLDDADFDGKSYIRCTNSSAVTLTLDTGLSPAGMLVIEKGGTGDVTVSGTATINGDSSITDQYGVLLLFPVGSDTYIGALLGGGGGGSNALSVETQSGTSDTLDDADFDGSSYIRCTSSSAVTLTLDTGLSPDGILYIEKAGTGDVTVSGTATINGDSSITTQYDVLALFPVGSDTYTGVLLSPDGAGSTPTESIIVAVSDETTDLTTGTGKVTFRMPYAFTLSGVRASVSTAPTGAALQVDINEGGVSILSTVLSIDDGEKTSETAATAAVISDTSLADDAEMTIDIDQIGSTVAGAGLKVTLIGTQT